MTETDNLVERLRSKRVRVPYGYFGYRIQPDPLSNAAANTIEAQAKEIKRLRDERRDYSATADECACGLEEMTARAEAAERERDEARDNGLAVLQGVLAKYHAAAVQRDAMRAVVEAACKLSDLRCHETGPAWRRLHASVAAYRVHVADGQGEARTNTGVSVYEVAESAAQIAKPHAFPAGLDLENPGDQLAVDRIIAERAASEGEGA